MTRSAGPALKRLHREFGDRVAFVSLYVREAHPGEDYPQPASDELKARHARAYRDREQLPWPVAVDDADGSLHRQLDPKPNAAYLMAADGTVLWRSLWANLEPVVREALEAAVTGRVPPRRQRQPRLRPMLAGAGTMWEILTMAGGYARRDVAREAPPMYATARLASLFRPLPFTARGALGMGLSMAPLLVALGWSARALARRAR